jgi:SAM-dependent methyltransferase
MKRFLRKKSKEVKDVSQNRYEEGGAWFKPYLQMHSAGARTERHYSRIVKGSFSEFYDNVTDLILKKFPNCSMCLDLGCAIGIGTSALARKYSVVLGVDQSFSFVWEARRRNDSHNLEFLVADTLKLPFPNGMFDLIIALNILDLLEPSDFLMHVKELSRKNGELVIADPYDFRDQKGDPQNIHDGKSIRRMLRSNGYVIDKDFRHESYLPWIIRINRRAYLVYFADFIIAKKLLP